MNEQPTTSETEDKQVRGAANAAAARATNAIDSARSSAHGAVDNVANQASAAVGWTAARLSSAAETPNRYLDAGADYIRQRPFVAVGIALGVGYVLGRLKS
ncbi:MAG TPA: hypothetical protein VMB76_13945 [Casimicrobiaceae bacterium]|jgi:ElaB/YqjD/DUF883 family membrane-anchored ribosome-binding protein|nr:hypothetical protein [Casimicrobiaceae bacterium]